MSDAETAPATATDAHDEASGHGHEPAAEPLGPIDVNAWLYAIGGGAIGVVVALALFVAGGT
jgi:hypothetical protein